MSAPLGSAITDSEWIDTHMATTVRAMITHPMMPQMMDIQLIRIAAGPCGQGA